MSHDVSAAFLSLYSELMESFRSGRGINRPPSRHLAYPVA